MNAEEAQKIISTFERERNFGHDLLHTAQGYLAALEGPEVAELIKALEAIMVIPEPIFNGERVTNLQPGEMSYKQKLAKETLACFQEMIKT